MKNQNQLVHKFAVVDKNHVSSWGNWAAHYSKHVTKEAADKMAEFASKQLGRVHISIAL